MIGARELIMAGVDAIALIDEHDDSEAAFIGAGLDYEETSRFARFSVRHYPTHLARLVEDGRQYGDALQICFAAAYCEGALAAARAVRDEDGDE